MTRREPAISLLLAALLLAAVSVRAQVRQWQVEIIDPDRPERALPTLLVGPDPGHEPCPLLVFGHATLTPVDHYAGLADSLAEAGWLVALPATESGFPTDHGAFATDLLAVARAIRDGAPGLPDDLPTVATGWALGGHSLGGGAAVLAAADAVDPPRALILLAPQVASRPSAIVAAPGVTTPTLLLSGEYDCLTPPEVHHEPLHDALAAVPRVLVTILAGGHCNFATPGEPCVGGETGCGHDLPPEAQQAVTRSLVGPWLGWHVGQEDSARLEFLARLQADDLEFDAVGLAPVSAPASGRASLRLLGAGPADGVVSWRLEMTTAAPVLAEMVDLRGRRLGNARIRAEGDGWLLTWDGHDDRGRLVPAGVYLLRVRVADEQFVSRVVRVD